MIFRALLHLAKEGESFDTHKAQVPAMAADILSRVIAKVTSLFPATYAGNLFKNISKCRELAAALNIYI
jgi:hypothetical protein